MPAGVSSMASIMFKDENEMLNKSDNTEDAYINEILPIKMKWNLSELKKYGFWHDIKVMFMTVFAVSGKEYKEEI